MINKYRHISFDLDGTLVHTVPEYIHRVVTEVVKELGGRISDDYFIYKFWVEASGDEIIRNHFSLEPQSFWKRFRKMDSPEKRSLHTRPYDDSEPALRKIKEMNKVVSIITGAPNSIAQMEIEKLNGAPYDFFLSIVDAGFIEKPDSKSFHHVLENLKIKPDETLYIGNSNEDAYYARNAGADFLYLNRNEHQPHFKDCSVETIRSLNELFGIEKPERELNKNT